MADIIRFTDPADDATVRLDITNDIAGEVAPDFGIPTEGRRIVVFQLALAGATKQAVADRWRDIARELERSSALEVRLDGLANSVWFDPLVTESDRPFAPDADRSTLAILYDWIEGTQHFIGCQLTLVCQPYARGAEVTLASAVDLSSAPNNANFVDIAAVDIAGDVESPCTAEIVFDTLPNRCLARLYRRTRGTPGNYIPLLEAEDATLTNGTASQSEAAASNQNSTRTTPANQNLNKTHAWSVSTNVADRRGLVHAWVKIKDGDTTPGRIKARLDLVDGDDQVIIKGETKTITADSDHDGNTSYELWLLGTYEIPELATGWKWVLYLQRTTGTATIDTDYLATLPADESACVIDWEADSNLTAHATKTISLDTPRRAAWWGTLSAARKPAALLGRGLWVKPRVLNRIIAQISADTHSGIDSPPSIVVDGIASITIKHRPWYTFIR